jgi:Helix-turn-helix domain
MSFQATGWAAKQLTKNVNTQCLLLILASFANDEGFSWPSLKTLSLMTRMSQSAVQRNLDLLVETGYIVKHARRIDGHQASNLYEFPAISAGGISDHLQVVPVTTSQVVTDDQKQVVTGDHLIVNTNSSESNDSSDLVNSQSKRPPAPEAKPKPAVKAKLPDDWVPTASDLRRALIDSPNVDLNETTKKFKNHFKAKGTKLEDWTARWRNWVLQESKWNEEKMGRQETLALMIRNITAQGYAPEPAIYKEYSQLVGGDGR